MSPRVAVLLASYNGEKWIRDQIDTILSQVGVEIHIFAADDLSSDSTLEILNEYQVSGSLSVIFDTRVGGPGANFIRLLCSECWYGFDFVALADQDDIWLPSKIARAVSVSKDRMLSYYASDSIAYFYHSKRYQYIRKSFPFTEFDYLIESGGAGHTILLSNSSCCILKKFLESSDSKVLNKFTINFDWLIYAYFRSHGMNCYIDKFSAVYYRQHNGNAIGSGFSILSIKKKLVRLFNGWYFNQIINLGEILGVSNNKMVIFFRFPSLHKLIELLRMSLNFRRNPVQNILFVTILLVIAFRGAIMQRSD